MMREDIYLNENEIQNSAKQAEQQQALDISEDKIIDAVATNILERFRLAFEELAK